MNFCGFLTREEAVKWRRLLVEVEACIPWERCQRLREAGHSERSDILKAVVPSPITVRCAGSGSGETSTFSFKLGFTTQNSEAVLPYLSDVIGASHPKDLLFEMTETSVQGAYNSEVREDPTTWPASKSVTRFLTVPGGDFLQRSWVYLSNLCFLSVAVKAYGPVGSALEPLRSPLAELRPFLCDVVLSAGGQDFPAHIAVLAASSPVFQRMFLAPMREGGERRVEIADVSQAAFGKFIELLYTGELADWGGLELELLQLADRYMVDHLKERCAAQVCRKLDGVSSLQVLSEAQHSTYIPSALTRRAMRRTFEEWDLVVKSPEWEDLQKSNPFLADILSAGNQNYPIIFQCP